MASNHGESEIIQEQLFSSSPSVPHIFQNFQIFFVWMKCQRSQREQLFSSSPTFLLLDSAPLTPHLLESKVYFRVREVFIENFLNFSSSAFEIHRGWQEGTCCGQICVACNRWWEVGRRRRQCPDASGPFSGSYQRGRVQTIKKIERNQLTAEGVRKIFSETNSSVSKSRMTFPRWSASVDKQL